MQFMSNHFIRNVFGFLNEASGGRYILRYNINSTNTIFWTMQKEANEFSNTNTMNWIHVYLSSPFYSDNGLIKLPKYCVTFLEYLKIISVFLVFIFFNSSLFWSSYYTSQSAVFPSVFTEIGPHSMIFRWQNVNDALRVRKNQSRRNFRA